MFEPSFSLIDRVLVLSYSSVILIPTRNTPVELGFSWEEHGGFNIFTNFISFLGENSYEFSLVDNIQFEKCIFRVKEMNEGCNTVFSRNATAVEQCEKVVENVIEKAQNYISEVGSPDSFCQKIHFC